MGSPISQVAPSTQPQGKNGFPAPRPAQQQSALGNAANAAAQQGAVTDYSLMQTDDVSLTPGQFNQQMMSPAVQPTGQFQPQGKGGNVTYPGQGGQPRMGQPNMYPNTVGQWDNASIQPQQSRNRGGKGKG